jgi:hypothetical protein
MSGPGFYDELWTVIDGAIGQDWEITTSSEYDAVVASVDGWWTPDGPSVGLFRVSHGHDPLTAEDVDQGAECVCAQYEQSHLPIREWVAS